MAKDPANWRARPGGGADVAVVHVVDGMAQIEARTRVRGRANSGAQPTRATRTGVPWIS
jgi:hypothetical protein